MLPVKNLIKIRFLNSVSFNKSCDSCSKAKHTRLPFPSSEIKSRDCFDLLHCDIQGTYRFPSFSRASYSLTITDDFCRSVLAFMLKLKHDSSKHVVNFHKLVKNQFGKCVKRIRCDNGGEFTSNDMLKFYNEQGILLETSCPQTPQQNGVVE